MNYAQFIILPYLLFMYALLFQICCPMLGDRYMCKKRADVEKM